MITIINRNMKAEEFAFVGPDTAIESQNFATYLPMEERCVRTFENIAQMKGKLKKKSDALVRFDKLAILKGDVDDLGKIFAIGLDKNSVHSVARLLGLSRLITQFFEGYLPTLIKKEFSLCYTVFVGGDDYTIIGPWQDIILLAIWLEKDFQTFVCKNSDVRMSSSITLFTVNTPIYHVIRQAENQLKNRAKEYKKDPDQSERSKHAIAIFEEDDGESWVIDAEDFPQVMQQARKFYNDYARTGAVSSGTLRFLLRSARLYMQEKDEERIWNGKPRIRPGRTRDAFSRTDIKKNTRLLMWRAQLVYHLERLYSDPDNEIHRHFKEFSEALFLELKDKPAYKHIRDNCVPFFIYILYLHRDDNPYE
jgi:hypothetical protein